MLKPYKPTPPKKPQITDVKTSYISTRVIYNEVADNIDLDHLTKLTGEKGAKLSIYLDQNNDDSYSTYFHTVNIKITVDDVITLPEEEIKAKFEQLNEAYKYRLESYEAEMVAYKKEMKVYEAKQAQKEAKLKAKLEKQLEQLNAKAKATQNS